MTAVRVITDHEELDGSGQVTHEQLDIYVNQTPWLVVSGTSDPAPPGARKLKAGTGISIADGGPGGDIVITATGAVATPIIWNEIPIGSNDGTNKQFILGFPPNPQPALMLFINGIKQRQGADSDYTLTGSIVNLITNYRSGSNIDATYPY